MAIKFDNLHWDSRSLDGYNKDWNIAVGPREPGKTTFMWVKKIYGNWKKDKRPWLYMVRQSVEITDALIESIFSVNMNKFTDDNLEPEYKKGAFKEGIVDVKIKGEIFIRIISLNLPLRRIKLAVLRNAVGAYMDEYIIDPKTGEKYVKDEFYKLKEAYTTWRRECNGRFKMWFTGNIYSMYCPIFVGLGINKLKPGEIIVGDFFAVERVVIKPELKAKLLEVNPLYKFDEDYASYGLEGEAINDKHIQLSNLPKNFSLSYLMKIDNKVIGIYRNDLWLNEEDPKYYCEFISNYASYRQVYCFDFEEMIEQCALLSPTDRQKFSRFKAAMQRNQVVFKEIAVYYLVVEIYQFL